MVERVLTGTPAKPPAAGHPDGRRERGRQRREAVVEAALRLVAREGVAAVTHRAVAREAGVALASTTYHFATLDDLLLAALTTAAERSAATLRAWRERLTPNADPVAAITGLVVRMTGPDRVQTIAEYELYMAAMRRPALLPAGREWTTALTEALLPWAVGELGARALVLALDGLVLDALMAPEPPATEELRPLVARLFRAADA